MGIKTNIINNIIKRDGRTVFFDKKNITDAIYKAAQAVGGEDYETAKILTEEVVEYLENNLETFPPTVEQAQDTVERILIKNGHARTAKAYIIYRENRTRVRNMDSTLMKTLEDLTFTSAKDSELKRENANVDGDTAMGTMLKYGSESAKQFYDMFILDPKHSEAHKNGDIHIHDLDFYTLTTTCCQIDLLGLFKDGFSTGHGFLREPQYITSYAALACIAIQSNQNDQHGGQSVPNFDYSLAPGVKKSFVKNYIHNLAIGLELLADMKTSKEIAKEIVESIKNETNFFPEIVISKDYLNIEIKKLQHYIDDDFLIKKIQKFAYKKAYEVTDKDTFKAMVAFVHNLNTMHSRAGAQTPFSSINYGTDTSEEGRMVVKNLLLATEKGLGKSETPIFPIQIFKVKEGVNYNPGDINYDLFELSCRVSAKRLFPNFSFLDAPFNKQYYKSGHPETEVAYMGCRTRVLSNIDKDNETVYGRGNLSFTSVNLPRLAIEANHDQDKFFSSLDEKMDLAIEQLFARYKIQCSKKVRNFPFLMGQGVWLDSEKLGYDDSIEEVLRHGTLSVGFIGLAETLKSLVGKHHGESKEAQKLGIEIILFMREKLDKACLDYNLNYSLIATPAEGLSGRFVKLDKEKYGTIEGITDREYYTNGFHVPVYYNISAFDKISIEAPYHELTNAGHISYIELDGDPTHNLDAFKQVVRHMKESGIGYGSINHPVDRDPVCGYTGIIEAECPQCGRMENDGQPSFERIRRITGYLVGTLDRFNDYKKAEVKDRVKHLGKKNR